MGGGVGGRRKKNKLSSLTLHLRELSPQSSDRARRTSKGKIKRGERWGGRGGGVGPTVGGESKDSIKKGESLISVLHTLLHDQSRKCCFNSKNHISSPVHKLIIKNYAAGQKQREEEGEEEEEVGGRGGNRRGALEKYRQIRSVD